MRRCMNATHTRAPALCFRTPHPALSLPSLSVSPCNLFQTSKANVVCASLFFWQKLFFLYKNFCVELCYSPWLDMKEKRYVRRATSTHTHRHRPSCLSPSFFSSSSSYNCLPSKLLCGTYSFILFYVFLLWLFADSVPDAHPPLLPVYSPSPPALTVCMWCTSVATRYRLTPHVVGCVRAKPLPATATLYN